MNERPRRTIRPTSKQPTLLAESKSTKNGVESAKKEIKKAPKLSEKLFDFEYLTQDPKSQLTRLDISRVINHDTWDTLSYESRQRLCALLPPTAFGYKSRNVDESHPARKHNLVEVIEEMAVDQTPENLDPSFFNDPHFESAGRTFQDHLFSGWLRPSHKMLVEKYKEAIGNGSFHSPWKDEAWDEAHPEFDDVDMSGDVNELPSALLPLIQKGQLRKGDVLTFKHHFRSSGITIEKDAMVITDDETGSHLRFLALAGSTASLPMQLLTADLPSKTLLPESRAYASGTVRELSASSSSQLASALMDLDGRVSREQRSRFHADKAFTVWRLKEESEKGGASEEERALLEKGGREKGGTVFYLRQQVEEESV